MKRRAPDAERDVASAYAEHPSRLPGELFCTSHSRTRPSATPPPLTTRPSGSTATVITPPSWRPSSAGLRLIRVPHQHPAVTPAADHPPVRQHRHRYHAAVVAAELGRAGPGRIRVPHQHPAVTNEATAGDHPPARQRRHRHHRVVVAAEFRIRAGLARRVVHWRTGPGSSEASCRVWQSAARASSPSSAACKHSWRGTNRDRRSLPGRAGGGPGPAPRRAWPPAAVRRGQQRQPFSARPVPRRHPGSGWQR
jgi:hypothetical protein